ncbi:MAG: hypothetical protein WD939_04070 [Dehalococcoidia bacterium]
MKTALILATLLASAFIWASCGDDNGTTPDGATPAATTPDGSTPATNETPAGVGTPQDFEGSLEPIERTFEQGVLPTALVGVAGANQTLWDRLVFEFQAGAPNYRIEYVEPPITDCGSGEPIEVRGEAFIQVRMFPAQAHDLEGQPTIESTRIEQNGPSMVEAVQTCDFEGEVIWVLGVTEEVPFRDFTLLPGTFTWQIVVDTRHP